jgi:hypothetical protein
MPCELVVEQLPSALCAGGRYHLSPYDKQLLHTSASARSCGLGALPHLQYDVATRHEHLHSSTAYHLRQHATCQLKAGAPTTGWVEPLQEAGKARRQGTPKHIPAHIAGTTTAACQQARHPLLLACYISRLSSTPHL